MKRFPPARERHLGERIIKCDSWHKRILWFLLFGAILRFALLFTVDITPQEAYYWNFSRHLAPGYFDHPSMMPWTIWFFTNIFGSSILGIRLGAWLYGIGAIFFLWLIARKFWGEKAAFCAVVAVFCVPLFTISGMIFTPDPPLVFFWLGAIYFLIRAFEEGKWRWWLLAGLFGGFAMLSKYTAVFLFLGAVLVLLLRRDARKYILTAKPYVALLTALLAFSPEIIWNAQNSWASFLYQSSRRAGEIGRFRFDYFGGYIGAQLLAVSPILYFGIWRESVRSIRDYLSGLLSRNCTAKTMPMEVLVILAFSVPMMLFFTAVALLYWVKLNWLITAYFLPASAFVAWSLKKGKRLHIWGTAVAALTTAIILFAAVVPAVPISGELASTIGWKELTARVENELSTMPENTFVFGMEYKVPSQLAYRLPGKPETMGPNIVGLPGQQFSYWAELDTFAGKNAICVIDPRWGIGTEQAEPLLHKYFENIEKTEPLKIFRAGAVVTEFYVYRCFGYRGLD